MNSFFPFIYEIKKDNEFQPLYIEIDIPIIQEEPELKEDEPKIIIIQL